MSIVRKVSVLGMSYCVTEEPGYLKAHLNGAFGGWIAVYASSYTNLVKRITHIANGGQ